MRRCGLRPRARHERCAATTSAGSRQGLAPTFPSSMPRAGCIWPIARVSRWRTPSTSLRRAEPGGQVPVEEAADVRDLGVDGAAHAGLQLAERCDVDPALGTVEGPRAD